MCRLDANIEISETYQSGIFFSALTFIEGLLFADAMPGKYGVERFLG